MGCSSSSVDTGTQFVTLPQQSTRPGTLVKQNDVNKVSDDKSITQNTTTKELKPNETASRPVDQDKNDDKNNEESYVQEIEYKPPSKEIIEYKHPPEETTEYKDPPEETTEYKHPPEENKVVPSAPGVPTPDLEDDPYEKQNQKEYSAFDF